MNSKSTMESIRLELQDCLDSLKTQDERNKLGQYATPIQLAVDVVKQAESYLPQNSHIYFFDPAIGTGSFYSALIASVERSRIKRAFGFEIDAHYAAPSRSLWAKHNLEITLSDFTKEAPPADNLFNLLICNPPYVRHHHILSSDKIRLQDLTAFHTGIRLSGLSGLYCHFLLLSKRWMAPNGIAAWLIPSEFMDVNYGKGVKDFLLNQVEIIRIHRADPKKVQFNDALVSSAILFLRNKTPNDDHAVELTFGGSIKSPLSSKMVSSKILIQENKWTRFPVLENKVKKSEFKFSDFFSIKRGLATGDNNFFILTKKQIEEKRLPLEFFKPVLPSPRHLNTDRIESDSEGMPCNVEPLFLLDCRLSEDEIEKTYPALWKYLLEGKKIGVNQRYLCKHRKIWYSQENRKPAPFLCTYMGRGSKKDTNPFRFILNQSTAIATNVYLLIYPKVHILKELESNNHLLVGVWNKMNNISEEILKKEGRIYGGGLHKLEPKELSNVPANEFARFFQFNPALKTQQLSFSL